MEKALNGICKGDIDYLARIVMYKMRENLLKGKPIDYLEENEEE